MVAQINSLNKQRCLSALAAFAVCALAFTYLSRFGVDPHHDGIMFGAALAASEGLVPFRDFFAMYGIPITVVQGAAFSIFEPTVLVLRGVSAVILAAAVSLFLTSWSINFGRRNGHFAILLLLATAPFASGNYQFFPWNSDLILLVQALAILVLRAPLTKEPNAVRFFPILWMTFLLSIILWSRLTTGATVILLVSLVLAASNQLSTLRSFWLTLVAVNVWPLGWLWFTGSVQEFRFQFLEFPRSLYVEDLGLFGLRQILSLLLLNLPLSLLIGFRKWSALLGRKCPTKSSAKIFLAATLLSLTTQVYLNRTSWNVWITRFVQETILWVCIILGVAQGFLMLYSLARLRRQDRVATDLRLHLQLAIVLGGFVQVFPVSDWYHLWWAVAPAIGFIVAEYAPEASTWWFSSIKYRAGIIGGVLIILLSSLAIKLSQDFVDSSSVRILRGSKMLRHEFEAIAPTMLFIQEIQTLAGSKSVMNICDNGIYLGLGEKVKLISPFYVSWSPRVGIDLSSSETSSFVREDKPIIIYCVSSDNSWESDRFNLFTEFLPLGYTLVSVSFCDTPVEEPQLFVGFSNDMDILSDSNFDSNPQLCVVDTKV